MLSWLWTVKCRDPDVQRTMDWLSGYITYLEQNLAEAQAQFREAALSNAPNKQQLMDSAKARIDQDKRTIDSGHKLLTYLSGLPPCPEQAPKTAAPPGAGGQPGLPPRVAHRSTTCDNPECRYWVNQYNEAADNYALARGAGPPEAAAYYRAQMQEAAQKLDECERRCRGQTLTVPTPAPTPATPPTPTPGPAPSPTPVPAPLPRRHRLRRPVPWRPHLACAFTQLPQWPLRASSPCSETLGSMPA